MDLKSTMIYRLQRYILLGFLSVFVPMSLSAVTIYFQNTANWSKVYIYTWNGGCNTGNWPGNEMTAIGDGYFQYETGCDNVTAIIFNNGSGGSGNQTENLTWDSSKPLFVWGTKTWQTYTPATSSAPCLAIHGNLTSDSWSSVKMTKSADETTASCTIMVSSESIGKEFGIKKLKSCDSDDQDKWWNTASGTTITSSNCTNIPFGENKGANAKINLTAVGDYVFTWDYTTSSLSVTYPATTPSSRYYATGNSAFQSALGCTGEWTPGAKQMTDGKVSFTAQSGVEYRFKITTGTWDHNWGYSDVDAECSNVEYTADGTNVKVQLSSTTLLTISFDGTHICITKAEAEPYPITFGVVDEIGGDLIATSEGSTIYSGTAVSSVTFTAQPSAGYTVEGWYKDAAGLVRIDAAGTSNTYTLNSVTQDNSIVYVKFAQARVIYLKANDCNTWSRKYVYTFSATPWENGKGVHPKNNRLEYGEMQQVNDSVYVYALTNPNAFSFVAFNSTDQSTYADFYQCEAVFRGDHADNLQMFVSERGAATETYNQTKYRNKGIWMRYNATNAGYKLVLNNTVDNTTDGRYFTTPALGTFSFSTSVSLVQGTTYKFYVQNDNNVAFSRGTDAGNLITSETKNYELFAWEDISTLTPISFTPTISGDYVFNLHLSDGKVLVDVLFPTTEYRLVYVEKQGDVTQKFHPSHTISQHVDATSESPALDTISLHLRPFLRDENGVEQANSNACEVWLQRYDAQGNTMTWTTIQSIDITAISSVTGNGVYNFVIQQDGSGVSVLTSETKMYEGNYFIRSDASKAGWDFSSARSHLQNRFWYSDYASRHESFDHYCCHWTTANTNLNFVVANEYSYCITDTLVQSDYEAANDFVDATGKLKKDANIRFMWNSYDNHIDRAFLAGAGNNLSLLSEKGIYDTGGTKRTEMQFSDQQNWVYRLDVKADPNTRIKIKAPYGGVSQYFKGKEGDFSDENTFLFIEGAMGNSYGIRVIYDFKTNHLICAWIPDGEITSSETIQTDLMIIRENQGNAKQLIFNPNELTIGKVNNAYCVLTITKEFLESAASSKEKTVYWVSFPFDVRLSEVFGCGTYGTHYAVQYYDGAARAENGCWVDSPTYWRHYWETNGVILKKGMGYVVDIDWQKILREQFTHGNKDVSIYFPSANSEPMDISGTLGTVEFPEHKCEIERDDRYIYDSNWNLMGVPSYANINEVGNPMVAEQIGRYKVGFLYEYTPSSASFVAVEADKTDFYSMQSYLVQFAGTVNWHTKSIEGTLPHQLLARQYSNESDSIEQHTVRIDLKSDGVSLDHTFVRMQEQEATTAFDMNFDLVKQERAGANIYSLTDDNIRVAANVLPMKKTITLPLGVIISQDGTYSFSTLDDTDGLEIILVDNADNTHTNLLFADHTVHLTKGTYDQRFAIEVRNSRVTTNEVKVFGEENTPLKKYMVDGKLYIQCGENVYDALGRNYK